MKCLKLINTNLFLLLFKQTRYNRPLPSLKEIQIDGTPEKAAYHNR